MKRIGYWIGRLLALAVLFTFLVAAEDGCTEEEDASPVVTTVPSEDMVTEPTDELEAELAYLDESGLLLEEDIEILDDYIVWIEDTIAQYKAEVMFPSKAGAEATLARAKDVTARIESLDVPSAYQESHDLWLEAQRELEAGIELGIAGVEQLDPDLIDQGSVRIAEVTRLMGLATDALP